MEWIYWSSKSVILAGQSRRGMKSDEILTGISISMKRSFYFLFMKMFPNFLSETCYFWEPIKSFQLLKACVLKFSKKATQHILLTTGLKIKKKIYVPKEMKHYYAIKWKPNNIVQCLISNIEQQYFQDKRSHQKKNLFFFTFSQKT